MSLYRDPLLCRTDLHGEQVLDACVDALLTVARASDGELVEASLGWYDALCALLWTDRREHELFEDIIEAAQRQARREVSDEQGLERMSAFVEMLCGSLAVAGSG